MSVDHVFLTDRLQEGFSRVSVEDQLLHAVGTSRQQRYRSDDDVIPSRVCDELSLMCVCCV